jgi:hypothetical protein
MVSEKSFVICIYFGYLFCLLPFVLDVGLV